MQAIAGDQPHRNSFGGSARMRTKRPSLIFLGDRMRRDPKSPPLNPDGSRLRPTVTGTKLKTKAQLPPKTAVWAMPASP
jgi:hypothetical protein